LWVLAIWTPKPTKVPKRNPPLGGGSFLAVFGFHNWEGGGIMRLA
jgi:hypothetical protein